MDEDNYKTIFKLVGSAFWINDLSKSHFILLGFQGFWLLRTKKFLKELTRWLQSPWLMVPISINLFLSRQQEEKEKIWRSNNSVYLNLYFMVYIWIKIKNTRQLLFHLPILRWEKRSSQHKKCHYEIAVIIGRSGSIFGQNR